LTSQWQNWTSCSAKVRQSSNFKAGHAHGGEANPYGGRSVGDPVFDPIWSRINEANTRVSTHLGGTDYQKYGADWSEDPTATFGQFDAFQWMMYWGDRPAMEFTAGTILHNLFGPVPERQNLSGRTRHSLVAVHAAQGRPCVPHGTQG